LCKGVKSNEGKKGEVSLGRANSGHSVRAHGTALKVVDLSPYHKAGAPGTIAKDFALIVCICVCKRASQMSMRDEYRTKAAEFQARARCASDGMTRLHFESLARDYEQLAVLAAQVDVIYKRPKIDNSRKPARPARRQ
jgi:hypothetical protein